MSVLGPSHVGVSVANMDLSLTFYQDVLGLEVFFDEVLDRPYLHQILKVPFTDIRIVRLRIPQNFTLELLEYRGCNRDARVPDPSQPAAGHLALEVASVAEIHERARKLGFPPLSAQPVLIDAGVNAGWIAAYLTDPDGYFVEIVQRPTIAEST